MNRYLVNYFVAVVYILFFPLWLVWGFALSNKIRKRQGAKQWNASKIWWEAKDLFWYSWRIILFIDRN